MQNADGSDRAATNVIYGAVRELLLSLKDGAKSTTTCMFSVNFREENC